LITFQGKSGFLEKDGNMNPRLFVGTRKGLFILEQRARGKPDWQIRSSSFLGAPVSMLLEDAREGRLYAALSHGHFGVKLHASSDGGASWHELACPTYPKQPAGEVDLDPGRGTPVPWELKLVWALEPGGADQPGRLWCGTIPGGLFRTDDSGGSWQLVRSLWDHPGRKQWSGGGADFPGIHSVCVDPRNSRHVRVGVSCGGVWESLDDGANWNCRADGMWAAYVPPEQKYNPGIQDVHRLAQSPSDPQTFWAQHHNGIFHSTDGAASWSEVTDVPPSSFGFAVVAHPHDAKTAWFVPATSDECRIPCDGQVVVTRTRDGGRSFEVLRSGLPQEHAFDISFRHALDISRDGRFLAFGSTTGSLWLSSDEGNHWQCLSEHLPPVYCVRFGA
jgi:hypothetical protein